MHACTTSCSNLWCFAGVPFVVHRIVITGKAELVSILARHNSVFSATIVLTIIVSSPRSLFFLGGGRGTESPVSTVCACSKILVHGSSKEKHGATMRCYGPLHQSQLELARLLSNGLLIPQRMEVIANGPGKTNMLTRWWEIEEQQSFQPQ